MTMKITFFMNIRSAGLSETWYAPDTSYSAALEDKIKRYITLRCGWSGSQTSFGIVRASVVGAARSTTIFNPSTVAGQITTGQFIFGGVAASSDVPTSALKLRKSAGPGIIPAFSYMRGYPDVVVDNGGNYIPVGNFVPALTAWINQLILSSWGWMGRTGAQPPVALIGASVTPVTVDPAGRPIVVLTAPWFTLDEVAAQKHFQVRISGVNGARTLNGPQVVTALRTDTFVTLRPVAILPYTGGGRVTRSSLQQIPIVTGSIDRVVERKTGRIAYVSAGRARNRVRG